MSSSILNSSVYFVWQWWEKHYKRFRPAAVDFDMLDKTYLERQKFLYEQFGLFGVGSSSPILDRNFVSRVMPFHTMIIPVVLGMNTEIQQVGGFAWKNMSVEQIKKLKPVNIADTVVGDLIIKQHKKRIDRYGVCTQMIDLASVTNNAFMMRGPDFYSDLLIDTEFAHHYMNVIKETMCMAYSFITEIFGQIKGFPLGNCNVTMMSPELYDAMICQYDIDCVNYAAAVTGKEPWCDLHHCDVKTEPFADVYNKIPGLNSLQGSYHSNIKEILEKNKNLKFSAMISPVELLNRSMEEVIQDIEKSVAAGTDNLAVWDIDPAFGPGKTRELFSSITMIAEKHGRSASFSIIPISWEELAWEFPEYQQKEF